MFEQTRGHAGQGTFSRMRNGFVVAGLLASVAFGGLGVATHAEARVPSGAKGDHAAACRGIQDDYDRTQREIADAKARGDYYTVQSLRTRLGHIFDAWDAECGDFGHISYLVVQAADQLNGAPRPGGVLDTGGPGKQTPGTSAATQPVTVVSRQE